MAALEMRDLTVEATSRGRRLPLVEGLGLTVERGEIVGLIGESGSGKTMTAMAVLGLLPRNAGIARGSIRLSGRELVGLAEAERRKLRGDRLALVPRTRSAASTRCSASDTQVGEPLNLHRGREPRGGGGRRRATCCARSTSPSPSDAPGTIPTSSRAACSSA